MRNSLNTVHDCIQKCNLKLYYTMRNPYINSVQKHGPVLWTWAHLRWTERQWTRVLWSDESKFQLLLGKADICFSKDEKEHPGCYQREVWSQRLWRYGVHQCPWQGWLHMCAEMDVGVLERYMLPLRWRLFPGGSWLFQQDDARPHSARLPTAWLHTQTVCAWPACLQSTSVFYWKCMEHHEEENQTTTTTDCWTAEILDSAKMNTDSSEKLQRSVSSVPKALKSVIRRRPRLSVTSITNKKETEDGKETNAKHLPQLKPYSLKITAWRCVLLASIIK